jgi:hypothetical protein
MIPDHVNSGQSGALGRGVRSLEAGPDPNPHRHLQVTPGPTWTRTPQCIVYGLFISLMYLRLNIRRFRNARRE